MKIKKMKGGKWNNGDLEQLTCVMQRQSVEVQLRIDASGTAAFAALGGVWDWLGGGQSDLRYTDSGRCESRALWSEGHTGRALFGDPALVTHGFVTRCDPAQRCLQVALLNPDLAMGLLSVRLTDGDATTGLALELTYSAVTEAGNALFDSGLADRMRALLEGLGAWLDGATGDVSPPTTEPVRRARRESVSESIVVRADADVVFPYACPVAELEWIEDWQFDLLHSVTGRNELHNLFCEPTSGAAVLRMLGADTYWYTNHWDPPRRQFHAVLLTRDLVCAQWQFQLHALQDGVCRMELTLTYTGLSPAGDRIVGEPDFAKRMRDMLIFVLTSARCYAETGKIYRLPHVRKASIALSVVGAALGRHLRRLHSRA